MDNRVAYHFIKLKFRQVQFFTNLSNLNVVISYTTPAVRYYQLLHMRLFLRGINFIDFTAIHEIFILEYSYQNTFHRKDTQMNLESTITQILSKLPPFETYIMPTEHPI